jgi:hypothetical protein
VAHSGQHHGIKMQLPLQFESSYHSITVFGLVTQSHVARRLPSSHNSVVSKKTFLHILLHVRGKGIRKSECPQDVNVRHGVLLTTLAEEATGAHRTAVQVYIEYWSPVITLWLICIYIKFSVHKKLHLAI